MSDKVIIPDEVVISKIYYMRDQKVMLDSDLADLYEIETRILNQQLKRNEDRFPEDFMFQLREMVLTHKDLLLEMEEIRKKVLGRDEKVEMIYNYLMQFIKEKEEPRSKIWYKLKNQSNG